MDFRGQVTTYVFDESLTRAIAVIDPDGVRRDIPYEAAEALRAKLDIFRPSRSVVTVLWDGEQDGISEGEDDPPSGDSRG